MLRSLTALRAYLDALLIAVLLATFARTFLVQAFQVPTVSMAESLIVGDHILVNKFIFGYGGGRSEGLERLLPVRAPRRGDVVVFKSPQDASRDYVKRCMGIPGDTVEIIAKVLYLNGSAVDDSRYTTRRDPRIYERSHFLAEAYRLRDHYGPYNVPDDHYFCLGDNRDHSNDSRFWGTVPSDMIKGRAWMVYWSSNPPEDPGSRGTIIGTLDRLRRWVVDLRPRRVFRLVR